MKEKKRIVLGSGAQKVLLYALPFMILCAFLFMLYIFRLDSATVLRERENIILFLETVSRLSVCVSLGTVLADYAERRVSETS